METPPEPTEVDLIQLSRSAVLKLIERALDGQLLPGISWTVEADHEPSRSGASTTVHFAVQGDLSTAIPLLDLPTEVQEAVLAEVEIFVRGRVSLHLDTEGYQKLRSTFGLNPPPDAARKAPEPDLIAAYARGLEMTGRGLDNIEDRAQELLESTLQGLLADADAASLDLERFEAGIRRLIGGYLDTLRERMDERRGRLAALDAELQGLASRPHAEAVPHLEAILGEEYVITSEAEGDLSDFQTAMRFALNQADETLLQ